MRSSGLADSLAPLSAPPRSHRWCRLRRRRRSTSRRRGAAVRARWRGPPEDQSPQDQSRQLGRHDSASRGQRRSAPVTTRPRLGEPHRGSARIQHVDLPAALERPQRAVVLRAVRCAIAIPMSFFIGDEVIGGTRCRCSPRSEASRCSCSPSSRVTGTARAVSYVHVGPDGGRPHHARDGARHGRSGSRSLDVRRSARASSSSAC